METETIEVRCAVCGGNSTSLPREQVSDGKLPTYTCKDCAQKRDKLGRPRKARDRKSLDLDHHTLRVDGERRGHERPAGMKNGSLRKDLLEWGVVRKATAPDGQLSEDRYELLPLLPGDSRVEEAQVRAELRRWAELHVFDCPEFLDLRPQDRAILKLFSAGETVRSIGERIGVSKSKAANAVRDAIKNMQKRIGTARGHESPQLARILAVVNGDREGDYDEPEAKGLADVEESHTARSLSVVGDIDESGSSQEREQDDWDNEDYADHMLD
jgi:hypothetical protein